MRNFYYRYVNKIVVALIAGIITTSCSLDNYDAPNASLYGTIYDSETGEPIQQDIIQGSKIDIVELGYENPSTRTLVFKNDGTYCNNNLFNGSYTVHPTRGNFFEVGTEEVQVKGKTQYDIYTRPYIRILDPNITFSETSGKVTATFRVECLSNNALKTIALFADANPNVAYGLRSFTTSKNIKKVVSEDRIFTLEMSTSDFTSGSDYYFRIAALTDGVSEATYNYCEAVRLHIDNSNVTGDSEEEKGVQLDSCDESDGWGGSFATEVDYGEKREGTGSVSTTGVAAGTVVVFQKVFSPFDTKVTKSSGTMQFDLYISDISKVTISSGGQIEITSSGKCDYNEYHWIISSDMGLTSGWNRLELSLDDVEISNGDADLTAINFMRIYFGKVTGEITMKIDNIRFW